MYSDDDVIKWKHYPRHWPFVRGIHRSPVTQRPVTRSFEVVFDLRLNKRLSKQSRPRWFEIHRAHYDVTAMWWYFCKYSAMRISTSSYNRLILGDVWFISIRITSHMSELNLLNDANLLRSAAPVSYVYFVFTGWRDQKWPTRPHEIWRRGLLRVSAHNSTVHIRRLA